MNVVHHDRGVYYLLQHENQYIFNVASGRRGVGFSISIALNKERKTTLLERGQSYLEELAEHVHQNQVTYLQNQIDQDKEKAMHAAIQQWLKDNNIRD